MRNTKSIEIFKGDEKRTVIVKELTVKEIRSFWQNHADTLLTGKGREWLSDMAPFFESCVSGVGFDDLDDMTPSEIKKIYSVFQEVNAVFFEVAKQVEGGNPLLVELRMIIGNILMSKFAGFFSRDTQTPGSTDTASSSPPST